MTSVMHTVALWAATAPVKVAAATALSAASTDGIIAAHPLVVSREGSASTESSRVVPGTDLAWDSRAASRARLHPDLIVSRLCIPLAVCGATSMLSSMLIVEFGVRVMGGSSVIPEVLAPHVMAGLARACSAASTWFVAMALWVFAEHKGYLTETRPTRPRLRVVAVCGWLVSALVLLWSLRA